MESHAKYFPPCQGIKEIPSGRMLEPPTKPEGSLEIGVPVEAIALAMRSLIEWWRRVLPGALLQTKACEPQASTEAPFALVGGAHL